MTWLRKLLTTPEMILLHGQLAEVIRQRDRMEQAYERCHRLYVAKFLECSKLQRELATMKELWKEKESKRA